MAREQSEVAERHIALLPKQWRFVVSDAEQLLYSGAVGAAKTFGLCSKLRARACVPGARELLVRKIGRDLHDSTLKTLLQGDGGMPPVLMPGEYNHNVQRQEIRIHGGGEILYRGLDDANRIGSINASGIAVEEAAELSARDWGLLATRKRLKVGIPRQIYAVCNPASATHHLARTFGIRGGSGSRTKHAEVIMTRTRDNPFLPRDYIPSLERSLSQHEFRRLVEGEWVGYEGLIFTQFDHEVHVVSRDGPWEQRILSVDDGYTNPFCVIEALVDDDGRAHVSRCRYGPGLLVKSKCDVIERLLYEDAESLPEVAGVEVDPAAAALRAELLNRGIPVRPAKNAVLQGIEMVRSRLEVQEDGRPRLTFEPLPEMEPIFEEFGSYRWAKNASGDAKEAPTKEDDHAMDALRYLVARLGKAVPGVQSLSLGNHDAQEASTED